MSAFVSRYNYLQISLYKCTTSELGQAHTECGWAKHVINPPFNLRHCFTDQHKNKLYKLIEKGLTYRIYVIQRRKTSNINKDSTWVT